PLVVTGRPGSEARAAADAALERVGLSDRRKHLPRQLSGGEQQRIAVARAFVRRPRLVWADEPTGNLDSASAEQVLGLFDELRGDGTTLVLVTHDASVASRADRCITMRDGRIVHGS